MIRIKAQINSFALYEDLLICGSDDASLRFFEIKFSISQKMFEDGSDIQLKYIGSQNRSGTDKTTFVACLNNLLFAHGIRDTFDVWQFNNKDEIKKRIKKRIKRVSEKRRS